MPRSSDAFDRFKAPRSDRVGKGLVVALVLVGVPFGEVDDRLVERVALAKVRRDRDRVTGAGMRAGERPCALPCVETKRGRI
jgi:hypothetical protein